MTTYPNARRGDIWYVSDDALGSKNADDRIIRGSRPVLIVSVDDHNFTSSCLTVVPISSGDRC
jgi:mRNA-degrading endonuclease toxin of MazEF toxin-antitoxin module